MVYLHGIHEKSQNIKNFFAGQRWVKEAKRMKKKILINWRTKNGHYCLYVDNVKVDYVKNNTRSSSPFTK